MSGLKLFFENGEGDIKIKNGQFIVEDDLNTLVLTSQFSDARAETDDPVDPLRPEKRGYWGEFLMAINGRRWGSKYWLFIRNTVNSETVNSINVTGKSSVQHLKDNGIVETITVETERQGIDRIAQQITYKEPEAETATRVTFRNLWDAIRQNL